MSEDLKERFDQAAKDVLTMSKAPDDLSKLRLYALYKQANEGDCQGKRPGLTNFVGRAKYDAWKALEGTTQDAAMEDYIQVVAELIEKDRG